MVIVIDQVQIFGIEVVSENKMRTPKIFTESRYFLLYHYHTHTVGVYVNAIDPKSICFYDRVVKFIFGGASSKKAKASKNGLFPPFAPSFIYFGTLLFATYCADEPALCKCTWARLSLAIPKSLGCRKFFAAKNT